MPKDGIGVSWVWDLRGGQRWGLLGNYCGEWVGEFEGGGWVWKQANRFGPIGWQDSVAVSYGGGNAPKRRRLN